MPTNAYPVIGFQKGLNSDGGPFQLDDKHYRDALNSEHNFQGLVENRRGIELINPLFQPQDETGTNMIVASVFYYGFKRNDGTILSAVILRYGHQIRIFANDGVTFTSSLENIDITSPDFSFTLADTSNEGFYYKTRFSTYGNVVIMTSPRSPIFKLTWGDESGSETFKINKIQLSEYNEDLFDLPRAVTRGKEVTGWFSREAIMKTGNTSYVVDFYFSDAAVDHAITVFKVKTDGTVTLVPDTDYTYAEAFDSTTDLVTSTLTYSSGLTGERLRIYFGKTTISDQTPSLAREVILVSNASKDYASDTSYAPGISAIFGGRVVFAGVRGPLDETDDLVFPTLGKKFNKIWVSEIFPATLEKEETTTLLCRGRRGPLDIDDNVTTPTAGGIITLDDASEIVGMVSYGGSLWVAAKNGVWRITGPEDFFSINQVIIKKIHSSTISSSEPLVVSDIGVYIFDDQEVYLIQLKGREFSINNITENVISTTYRAIDTVAKSQSFARYDYQRKRVYYCWSEDSTTQGQNKYDTSGAADKFLVFDEITGSWFGSWAITAGVWKLFDFVTVPADSFFASSDHRKAEFNRVNFAIIGKKSGSFTDFHFSILEGKPYCADYHGTSFKAAFDSFFETINMIPKHEGRIVSKVQVARFVVLMKRQEKADATAGLYEYPGALYLRRRWDFADTDSAGPLFEHDINSAQTSWVQGQRQIYFPHHYGLSQFGGGIPPKNVIVSSQQKLRGRGSAIAFRFGNDFGATALTGTIQEQEKGWGVYGFELDLKEYK